MISKSFQRGEKSVREEIRVFMLNTLSDLQAQYKTEDGIRQSDLFQEMATLAKEIILFLIKLFKKVKPVSINILEYPIL